MFESEALIEAGAARCAMPERADRRGSIQRTLVRSHFRPVLDMLRITRMVAWQLFTRGFDLPALVRSLSPAKT